MFILTLACFSGYSISHSNFKLRYKAKGCQLVPEEPITVTMLALDVALSFNHQTVFTATNLFVPVPQNAGSRFGNIIVSNMDESKIVYVVKPTQDWLVAAIAIGSVTAVLALLFIVFATLYLKALFLEQMRKDLDEELLRASRFYVYAEGDEQRILGPKIKEYHQVLQKYQPKEVICII